MINIIKMKNTQNTPRLQLSNNEEAVLGGLGSTSAARYCNFPIVLTFPTMRKQCWVGGGDDRSYKGH